MTLAAQVGLPQLLTDKIHIAAPRMKSGSTNPSPKLTTLITGMCAGTDDDLDITTGSTRTRAQASTGPLDMGLGDRIRMRAAKSAQLGGRATTQPATPLRPRRDAQVGGAAGSKRGCICCLGGFRCACGGGGGK
jgi:hypothetical protein